VLPKAEFASGETITGQLSITPQKNFDASELRLELVCSETVHYEMGMSKDILFKTRLAGKTKLEAGVPLSVPFQVNVPAPCPPSYACDLFNNTWKLRGVLARTLRKDTIVESDLNIYTGNPA